MPATIQHLVVLMMENRSFDHMLGYMKSPGYAIDGLNGTETNRDSTGEPVRVNNQAQYSGDLSTDPSHDFQDVMEQMFGTQTPQPGQQPTMSGFVQNYERFTHNRERSAVIMNCFSPARLPILTVLAQQYAVCDRWFSSVPGPTLPNRSYAHAGTSRGRLDLSPISARLPILTVLAQQYAVCDRWFSSVPGPTLPNRSYAHAGTSRGRLDLSP